MKTIYDTYVVTDIINRRTLNRSTLFLCTYTGLPNYKKKSSEVWIACIYCSIIHTYILPHTISVARLLLLLTVANEFLAEMFA